MDKILYANQKRYLDSLKKSRDELLIEMEEYAEKYSIPILDIHAAEFLEQMIEIKRPDRVLEIGSAIGYSSIRIARCLRRRGVLDAIEKSKDNLEISKKYFAKAELEEKINLMEGDAHTIMPTLTNKYDLIFLDADKEDYEKLFYYSIMLLEKRGVLFVDNLLWHGFTAAKTVPIEYRESTKHIRKFNELFMNQPGLNSKILPIGDGIGLAIKE